MHVSMPFFSIDLPEGFSVQSEQDPFSAFSMLRQCEITVAIGNFVAEADVEEMLARVDDANRRSLRQLGTGVRFMPATLHESTRHVSVGSLAVGGFALFSACFVVAREHPVGGIRYFANLCVHQHADGSGCDDAATFLDFCRAVASTLVIAPEGDAIERALSRRDALDPERLYPYLVTEQYFDGSELRTEATPIGNGLWLLFAEDNDGVVRVLSGPRCKRLGLVEEPLDVARRNLARAAQGGMFSMGLTTARNGETVLLVGPHWLAASCLFLPGLDLIASRHLGRHEVLACAPHRDILYVFAERDEGTQRTMRAQIEVVESNDPKPLSMEFFRLTEHGCESLHPAHGET